MLTGTHDPMKIAKPILGIRIVAKFVAKDSMKVQTVHKKHAINQIHLRG